MAAGCLLPKNGRDVLLVGTPSSLQCYDVDQNKDLFFKDVPDGVNVMVIGQLASADSPLAIVGGNCSVQVCMGTARMATHATWGILVHLQACELIGRTYAA